MDLKLIFGIAFVATVTSLPQGGPPADGDFQAKYTNLQQNMEKTARAVLKAMEIETDEKISNLALKDWKFENHVNDENLFEQVDAAVEFSKWDKQTRSQARSWKDLFPDLEDAELKRQFTLLSRPKTIELPVNDLAKYYELQGEMKREYSAKSVCLEFECGLKLQPEIEHQLKNNRDYEQLKRMWLSWRSGNENTFKPLFRSFVELSNEGAKNIGYKDRGQMSRVPYESSNLKGDLLKQHDELTPFYKQLHAYVRSQLREQYGSTNIPENGPIPSHLFGDIAGNDWSNIYGIVKPFKKQPSVDVTERMEREGYSGERVYRMADKYYQSLGFPAATENFWRNSKFSRSRDQQMSCTEEDYEITTGEDFRIKDCKNPSFRQYMDAIRNLGKMHYSQQYKDQPSAFRQAANPAFREAVGETIALSAALPKDLHREQLVDSPEFNEEQSINFLMKQALRILPEMNYNYMAEQYRWDIFEGKTTFDNLNCNWIERGYSVLGIKPPNMRSERDFDAASDLEVLTRDDNTRYFASRPLQFQMFKSLCEHAGQYVAGDVAKPLHACSLYESQDAGTKLAHLMKEGTSKPWKDTFQTLTGASEMSTAPMLEYFQPLMDWMTAQNAEKAEYVGWEKDGEYCGAEPVSANARSDVACSYVRTTNGIKCI